ncbi:MAG: DEAD/DEAH box helicase [Myxococcota bacterium]|jgi:ATP-dependent Lhr-like helicase|nr:DEAD/DEAH box helicase [Myxococcota bacterium]
MTVLPSAFPLAPFHPKVRDWFETRYGHPTLAQSLAFPRIASGEHVLVTAPTGSGKTLCAFLFAIDRLLSGHWDRGEVRVLYVSPLRALGNDIERNLFEPLDALGRAFALSGEHGPSVRAAVRTGDTPPEERRRQMRRPPEIFITTPESLAILLTQAKGEALLSGVQVVIVDEIHALCGNRRGVHLSTSLERLDALCGGFQRIGLSATVNPLTEVAAWLGGRELKTTPAGDRVHSARPVCIVDGRGKKAYDVRIRIAPQLGGESLPDERVPGSPSWLAIAASVTEHVEKNRCTLVFAQSRRNCERLARLINERADRTLVYSHHGSLAREIREGVEQRLKGGSLPGVVATSSLELGIDIGAIDEVVLVGSPGSAASTIQRIGRAGHGVGLLSRAALYPTHVLDLIRGAVVLRCAVEGELEPLILPRTPLDVLAQVLLSMLCVHPATEQELFERIRCAQPYFDLSFEELETVLDLLRGKHASVSRALSPRVDEDPATGLLRARRYVPRLIYQAGGTIPDRGMFKLRHAQTGALIGELDEEFVWERTLGDVLVFGVQAWRIEAIGNDDVRVLPATSKAAMPPFWRSDEEAAPPFLAQKMAELLETLDEHLLAGTAETTLVETARFEPGAARALVEALALQRSRTGVSLPGRHHLVVESIEAGEGGEHEGLVVFHTFFGGLVNRALLLALMAHMEETHGVRLEGTCDDGGVLLELNAEVDPEALLRTALRRDLRELIARKLQGSGLYGAAFRRSAGRALLLPRSGFEKRTPLWLTRKRASELLEASTALPRFPIAVEAFRSVWSEELSVDGLEARAEELCCGVIRVSSCRTLQPSPLCGEVIWRRTGSLMYLDDAPRKSPSDAHSPLSLSAAIPNWRRAIEPRLSVELSARLQRTYNGYAPWDAAELATWIAQRWFVPFAQWRALLSSMSARDNLSETQIEDGLVRAALAVTLDGKPLGIASPCMAQALVDALGWNSPEFRYVGDRQTVVELPSSDETPTLEEVVEHELAYRAIASAGELALDLALDESRLFHALAVLENASLVVTGHLTEGADKPQACTLANMERCLRAARAASRPLLPVLPGRAFPLLVAQLHGLGETPPEQLSARFAQLSGFPAPACAWEEELLPARCPKYRAPLLDALMSNGDVLWLGCSKERLCLLLRGDLSAVVPALDAEKAGEDVLLPSGPGRYTVEDLLELRGLSEPTKLVPQLWELAWQGLVTADSFAAVRVGLRTDFGKSPATASAKRVLRTQLRSALRLPGAWHRPRRPQKPLSAVDRATDSRLKAELLLRRYGVVFRELVERELPWLSWPSVSTGLRLLELGGSAASGRFFEGTSGIQFASHEAVAILQSGLDERRVFWMGSSDPACVRLDMQEGALSARRTQGSLFIHEGSRMMVAMSGKQLEISAATKGSSFEVVLERLGAAVLATRGARGIEIESINGQLATTSPYRDELSQAFELCSDHRRLWLRPKKVTP